MKTYADVSYGSVDGEDFLLDIFAPDGAPKCALMYLHGGGLENGSRKGLDDAAMLLTQNDFGLVSVEYRMFPHAAYPDFLVDSAQAASWLLQNGQYYGLDCPVCIGGSSAGAYLSMMLCFAKEYLGQFGCKPDDFAGYLFDAGQPTTHFNVLAHRGMDPRRIVVDAAAPLYHIEDASPKRPMLILAAEHDMPGRLEQNKLLLATLEHFHYPMELVDFHVMPGYQHCEYDSARDETGHLVFWEMVVRFLQRVTQIAGNGFAPTGGPLPRTPAILQIPD